MLQNHHTIAVCSRAGSLTLYMKPLKGERVKIFSDSLNQGGMWRHGSGNVSPGLEDWQVQRQRLPECAVTTQSIFHPLNQDDAVRSFRSTVGVRGGRSRRQRLLCCSRWHRTFSWSMPGSRFVSAWAWVISVYTYIYIYTYSCCDPSQQEVTNSSTLLVL